MLLDQLEFYWYCNQDGDIAYFTTLLEQVEDRQRQKNRLKHAPQLVSLIIKSQHIGEDY